MDNLLFSLALGVGLIVVVSLLLFRFSPLGATQTAVVVTLATLGIYVPLAIVYWPGGDVLAIHLAVYLITCFACASFMGVRERARAEGKRSGFHWGPAAIVGFFVIVVAVDAIFIVVAERGLSPQLSDRLLPEARRGEVSSVFPGVTSHDFQEKENIYNAYLRQVERQQQRGWQVQKGWLRKPVLGETAVFKVVARTREGEPVQGAEVTGQFLRPSDSRMDLDFAMEETEPGIYRSSLAMPAAGRWDLVLQLRQGDELHEIRASTSVLAR